MTNMKLRDFCIPQKKSNIKAGCGTEKGKYKFFSSSSIQSKFYDEAIYNQPALIFGTGGSASVHFCDEPFSTSTDCLVFYGNGKVNLKTVYLFLEGHIYLLESGFKGAGLKHVSKDYILDLSIDLPSLNEQKKIAQILDKASNLISLRKKQIEKLDLLVKARFVEKYANGSPDYENWAKFKIEEIVENRKGSMRTGPFGSDLLHSEFVDRGVFVLGIDNAVENNFTWNRMRYITEEKYEQLKRYTVYPGDVIITIMATIGRSAVIPDDFPKAINTKHLVCLTLDRKKANPYYISYCIHEHPYVLEQLKSECKGAIMDGLNLTVIRGIQIPLPLLEIQNEFVEFKNKVDKQKLEMQAGLEKLEQNYKALIQQYFG